MIPGSQSIPRAHHRGPSPHLRLKTLPVELFGEVKERIARGWTAREVARHVQKKGWCVDIKEESLRMAVIRFRRSLAPADVVLRPIPALAWAHGELENGGIVLDELWNLYKAQLRRVDAQEAAEKRTGVLVPEGRRELELAWQILVTHSEVARALGLVRPPSSAEVAEGGAAYSSAEVERTLMSPAARRKVLRVAMAFLEQHRRPEPKS